ncbi:molybdenum cofactor biosynthesis protein MoaE [Numidum massiliense]|uniref:molybdenum cofactor biosynthesis protein MoaE n=1 Tax=Numidum massiliense TaxID=1522315 RepID=UPI0006D5A663|nr:molybdenum cofactor biosynthesis protein MoaE [Numidum massiliense]
MTYCAITNERIRIEDVVAAVSNPLAGAVCTFIGTVRELTGDKKTLYLQYEAYTEMAERKLKQIAAEIKEQHAGAKVAIVHRIGRLDIEDVAVAIAVATPHRPEAFAACRYAIERLKEIVPIWKKEHWADGSFWVGDQQERVAYPTGKPPREGSE